MASNAEKPTTLSALAQLLLFSLILPERGTMKRGKILRDPRTGPGLLMIEGRQYWFSMEGVWKSEVPPKPGLAVDVKLDRAGQILAITAVFESQLANEQAERSVDKAEAAGLKIFRKIAAKMWMRDLTRR